MNSRRGVALMATERQPQPSRRPPRQPPPQPPPVPKPEPADAPNPPAAVGDNSAVLDTSGAGGPFIPHAAGGGGPMGVMGSASGAVPANEELIVEVELAPGAASIGSALTANTAGFLAGTGGAAPPSDWGLSAVLRQYGLREARPVFTREQVQ